MRFAAAVSRREDTGEAAMQLADSIQHQLPGTIDLLSVFFTYHHREAAETLAASLRRKLAPRVLIGCSCEGVIGSDKEIEREPGISVLAGRLPGVHLAPFHIAIEEWEDLLVPEGAARLRRRLGLSGSSAPTPRAFVALADPFTTPA